MYLSEDQLRELEARLGRPERMVGDFPIDEREMRMLLSSQVGGRAHDITFFVFNPQGHLVVIRKPFHPLGVYRAPSGGVDPGEAIEVACYRELWEEAGIRADFERYLLRADVRFLQGGRAVPWSTHVLLGRTVATELEPHDREEIAEARFATIGELQGPIRAALLATGGGLFRYRVALTDRVVALLSASASLDDGGIP